jgi:hypothetical protein
MAKRAVVSKETSTSWDELEDVLANGPKPFAPLGQSWMLL